MLKKLEDYTRHLLNDRRDIRRRRVDYDAVLRDEASQLIFRGRTKNISSSGVKLHGLPVGLGLETGQRVRVEFLVIPRDAGQVARRPTFTGCIVRIDDNDGDYNVAIAFDEPYENIE